MIIRFCKYHGTGNDFIMIDDRENKFDSENISLIATLCDRHFGIGADGLILIRKHTDFDFGMLYFNSDGKPGTMCGNGGRCSIYFAKKLGIIKENARFISGGNEYTGEINGDVVRLNMRDVLSLSKYEDSLGDGIVLDTGSPHLVVFKENVKDLDVFAEGKKLRYNDTFKEGGINVDFVKITDDKNIYVRTYERGVEDETLSCGTGVVASAIATSFILNSSNTCFNVATLGGNLKVHFHKSGIYEKIVLEGKATFVFEGKIEVN